MFLLLYFLAGVIAYLFDLTNDKLANKLANKLMLVGLLLIVGVSAWIIKDKIADGLNTLDDLKNKFVSEGYP